MEVNSPKEREVYSLKEREVYSLKETEVDSSKDTKIELNLVPSSQFEPNPERLKVEDSKCKLCSKVFSIKASLLNHEESVANRIR